METLDALTRAFDQTPATGGSGGGGPNKNIWAKPEPQAVLGMNSNFVYGTNVSVACPLNFQVALGSNVQVCINPNAWQTLYMDGSVPGPPELNQVLGSGLGGNMQLTMGTSASFVMGQIFDINLGPRRITLDVHNKSGIQKCVGVIGSFIMGVTLIFVIAYGAVSDDDKRATLVGIFQALMQLMIGVAMNTQGIYHQMEQSYREALEQSFTFAADAKHPNAGTGFEATFEGNAIGTSVQGALEATSILLMGVLPVLMEIGGESKLRDPQPGDAVVDDGGRQIGNVQGYDGS